MLDERRNSYLLSVCMDGDRAGLAFVDVSTGEFQLYEIERASVRLQDEIVRMMPKEIIANTALPENATTLHVDVQDGARFQLAARARHCWSILRCRVWIPSASAG